MAAETKKSIEAINLISRQVIVPNGGTVKYLSLNMQGYDSTQYKPIAEKLKQAAKEQAVPIIALQWVKKDTHTPVEKLLDDIFESDSDNWKFHFNPKGSRLTLYNKNKLILQQVSQSGGTQLSFVDSDSQKYFSFCNMLPTPERSDRHAANNQTNEKTEKPKHFAAHETKQTPTTKPVSTPVKVLAASTTILASATGFGLWAMMTSASIGQIMIGTGLTVLAGIVWPLAAAAAVVAIAAIAYIAYKKGCFNCRLKATPDPNIDLTRPTGNYHQI